MLHTHTYSYILQFLVNTDHALAITYNDMSPLENMHCATAFRAAKETMVLGQLDNGDKRALRKQVVGMVLATDMAQHFTIVAKFKAKLGKWSSAAGIQLGNMEPLSPKSVADPNSPKQYDRIRSLVVSSPVQNYNNGLTVDTQPPSLVQHAMEAGAEDRLEVLCMCAKNSDISNVAKPWHVHESWSKRVLQEFFAQGEAEAERGLAVSQLCNRDEIDIFKSQMGFIDFVAKPLFTTWCSFLRSPKVSGDMGIDNKPNGDLQGISQNRANWVAKQEARDSDAPYKDRALLRATLFELQSGSKHGAKLGTRLTHISPARPAPPTHPHTHTHTHTH
jgi:hypothetical protein